MMISEFSIFGSGASIHIFSKKLNGDIDEDYISSCSLEDVTLISLMSKPLDFDDDSINSSYDYDNVCVRHDLTKDFLDFLKDYKDVEYLIIDTYNDVEFNVIRVDDSYVTGSPRLKAVDYYNSVKDNRILDIHNDFDEYFEIWKDSCDRFFAFLAENRPDIKIILNMARLCYRYRENKKILEKESFKSKSKDNALRDMLDYYIIENYDVEILRFSEDTLIDKNHIFGLQPTHYESEYFTEKNIQLARIVQKNILYDYDDPVNVKIREIDRKDLLFDRQYGEMKKTDSEL